MNGRSSVNGDRKERADVLLKDVFKHRSYKSQLQENAVSAVLEGPNNI